MAEPLPFKYRAFISYSHADTARAKWLHRALETFRIDKDLAGRETPAGPIPKALRPIFRDRDDFTAGHALTDQTQAALDASHALIVICSPAAANSRYVNEEVRLFKWRHPERPLIPLIVAGKPDDPDAECFPPALKFTLDSDGQITDQPVELLAADLREQGDGKSLALAKVVAGLLGVSSDEIFRRAERDRRHRQRNWIAGLASVALLLAGLSIWAELNRREAVAQRAVAEAQKKIAERRRQEAERNFEVAKQGANALVFDIAQALRNQEGMRIETVRKILGTAENVVGKLVKKSDNNPALLHLQSTMLGEFSETYRLQGDIAKQEETARKELAIAESGAKQFPRDENFKAALATAYTKVGDALKGKGKLEEALEFYDKGLAADRGLAAAHPHDLGRQSHIALCDERIGDALLAQGKLADALGAFQESFAIRKRIAAAPSGTGEDQRALALTYGRLGDVLKAQGKLADALKSYRDGRDIDQRMAEADPGDAGWGSLLFDAHKNIGDALLLQGDLASALTSFQDMLAIADRVAKLDPANRSRENDVATAYDRIGFALNAQGKTEEALDAYRKSLTLSERIAEAEPNNAAWQHNLAVAYNEIGTMLAAQGKFDEALEQYRLDLDIAQRLANDDPTNANRQRELEIVQSKIGDALMQQRKFDEARQSYEAQHAIAEHLAEIDPSHADRQRELGIAHQRIAYVSAMQGDYSGSEIAYRKSFEISKRLAAQDESNSEWQLDLARAYGSLAAILSLEDKLAEALAADAAEAAILERLVKHDPANALWRKSLDDTASAIGDLAHRFALAQDFAKALEAADRAIALKPDATWLYAAKAPALMGLGRSDEARGLYLKYRGTPKVLGESSWEDLVRADFTTLRKAGFTDPLMAEIEDAFTPAENAGEITHAPAPQEAAQTTRSAP